jgi:alanine racemase
VANYEYVKQNLKSGTECGVVVKDDFYGIGAIQGSVVLYEAGCRKFFVADLIEAIKLRENLQPDAQIIVFSGVTANDVNHFFAYNLIPVLNSLEQIYLWNNFALEKKLKLPTIINVDTGMCRTGLCGIKSEKKEYGEEIDTFIKLRNEGKLSGLNILYIMSHLSCADDPSDELNKRQLSIFKKIKEEILEEVKFSLANSPAIFLGEEYHFDLVRPGSVLLGMQVTNDKILPIHKVISFTTKISQVIRIKRDGERVGYGGTYFAAKNSDIATIHVGHADGLSRRLGNKGYVYINGQSAKIIGTIAADYTAVDVTNISRVKSGDVVEIIGENITITDIAKMAGILLIEITTAIGRSNKVNKEYRGTGSVGEHKKVGGNFITSLSKWLVIEYAPCELPPTFSCSPISCCYARWGYRSKTPIRPNVFFRRTG